MVQISLRENPRSKHIGDTIPSSTKAINIANSILKYFCEFNLTQSEIVCTGCDGYRQG